MKRQSLLLFALLTLFSFASCNDDDEDPSFDKRLLVNKAWVMTEIVWQQNNGADESRYWWLEDCQKDNELVFYDNGTYELKPGEQICATNNRKTGTWKLYGNQVLVADIAGTILELSETTLKLQHVSTQDGIQETTNVTYRVK